MPTPSPFVFRCAVFLHICCLFVLAAHAAPTSMSIYVQPRDQIDRMLDGPISLYLDGAIESSTPRLLQEAIASAETNSFHVYLNSPGGNLAAGMEIGRILRKANASVSVGTRGAKGRAGPGECMSSCSLAFLGGAFRYEATGSVYGVHRFSKIAGPSATDLDTAQIVTAAIGAYIREMDIEPGLLDLAVKAGPDGIYALSQAEMLTLRVVNNGRKRPAWSIEAVDGGTFLKGIQETAFGVGTIRFICIGRKPLMMSTYTAGEKAAAIAKGGWFHSTMFNDDLLPLPNPELIKADGGRIDSLFVIDAEVLRRMQRASKIGHAMQMAREAPTFVGFTVDVDAESKERVATYARNCARDFDKK